MTIEQESYAQRDHDDAATAARLAEQVKASADGVTWRKTTTLLDLFGAYRLTTEVRERIAAALAQAGLDCKPPITDVQRFETVRLALDEDRDGQPDEPETHRTRTMSRLLPIDDVLDVTEWRPGQPPERKDLFSLAPASDAVRWFHIDVIHSEPEAIHGALEPLCPGLTLQMVVDLFTVDPRPFVHSYTDEPHLRMVSAFAVHANESEEGAADAEASKAGALVFQLVEILAGDGWMITCWHRSKRYHGAEEIVEAEATGREEVLEGVQHWWLQGGQSTAGDLATLLLHELVLTYPSAARVMLSWLEQWELDFHRRYDQTERHTLIDVRSLLAELEERLRAIERPEADPEDAWFTRLGGTKWAHRVQRLMDRALADLESIHGTLRSSLDLLGVHSAAQQLKLAQDQAQSSERLQNALAIVTSVLLVPTFIAGTFGANTQIPGQGEWWGFLLMVALMVLGAIGTYALIRPRRRDE
jgi:CorA-like Mg2+ transporter protein